MHLLKLLYLYYVKLVTAKIGGTGVADWTNRIADRKEMVINRSVQYCRKYAGLLYASFKIMTSFKILLGGKGLMCMQACVNTREPT